MHRDPSHFEIGPKAQGFSIYERNGRKWLTLTGGHEEQFSNIGKYNYRYYTKHVLYIGSFGGGMAEERLDLNVYTGQTMAQ